MPHAAKFDADFVRYATTRTRALKRIRELSCYLKQLEQAVKAMPSDGQNAGYLDLDNIQQINGDLGEVIDDFCDWDSLDMEHCRLGLPAE